jgi:hypothetical protein
MKVRSPTRALTKTYVRPKTVRDGTVKDGQKSQTRRYEAKLVLDDGSELDCTRGSMREAMNCVRKRAGIKS